MTAIRLHIPGIPHTITRPEFSHCAFTGKVLRFAPMMRSRGFEVYHYGVETSESGATHDEELMTKDEWVQLRYDSYKQLHPEMTMAAVKAKLGDPTSFVGDLANWDTVLYKVFNQRLVAALRRNYRGRGTDIFCMPMWKFHAIDEVPMLVVESGIGYPNSAADYRIFESYAWMHHACGKEGETGDELLVRRAELFRFTGLAVASFAQS